MHEGGQLPARPPGGNALERRAPREHQADHEACQLLAQRQGAEHRDQGDRVHAEAMLDDDRAADLDRQLGGEDRDRGSPHHLAGGSLAGGKEQPTHSHRRDRERGQDLGACLLRATAWASALPMT